MTGINTQYHILGMGKGTVPVYRAGYYVFLHFISVYRCPYIQDWFTGVGSATVWILEKITILALWPWNTTLGRLKLHTPSSYDLRKLYSKSSSNADEDL